MYTHTTHSVYQTIASESISFKGCWPICSLTVLSILKYLHLPLLFIFLLPRDPILYACMHLHTTPINFIMFSVSKNVDHNSFIVRANACCTFNLVSTCDTLDYHYNCSFVSRDLIIQMTSLMHHFSTPTTGMSVQYVMFKTPAGSLLWPFTSI